MDKAQSPAIKIWDISVRLWHWSIVGLIAFLWYSAEIADDLMDLHIQAGRLVLTLVLFRLVWGFIGSDTARFSQFITRPSQAFSELKSLFRPGSPKPYLGHNPAGGWMVIALLVLMALQAISGLFAADDYFMYEGPWASWLSGPWPERITELHHIGFKILQAAILIHILAVVIHAIKGDRLVPAMVTGKKKLSDTTVSEDKQLQWQSPFLALALLVVCWLIVFTATSLG